MIITEHFVEHDKYTVFLGDVIAIRNNHDCCELICNNGCSIEFSCVNDVELEQLKAAWINTRIIT